MVDTTTAGARPLHRGLPDEIAIWEILVRLTPKALLRCRAVCHAWRHAVSTRDFLLAHHARQPTLPLLSGYNSDSLDIIALDRRAGLAAADQLESIARLGSDNFCPEASCDGLLVLSIHVTHFCICNPATRSYAPFPQLHGCTIVGMYLHPPSGEYRLLVNKDQNLMFDETAPKYACYVFTIGSGQPPRHIGIPDAWRLMYSPCISSHGSLHWHTRQMIVVFDTTSESFREMRPPIVSDSVDMFEIDGMLGVCSFNGEATIMDIWVMQDYEGEVWAFKNRVELSIAEITAQFEEFDCHWTVVVESLCGDVLVLLRFGDWLLQVDMNGKLVASFHRRDLSPTQLQLKQTLVSHTFFPKLEGYVVNASPFI